MLHMLLQTKWPSKEEFEENLKNAISLYNGEKDEEKKEIDDSELDNPKNNNVDSIGNDLFIY